MAKLQVMTLDNLKLYDELLKGYVDAADAKSIKALALDGNTLKVYNVPRPVGDTEPMYSIELPEADLSGLIAKIENATAGNVVIANADGTVADGGVAVADLALKTEVNAVDAKADQNATDIAALQTNKANASDVYTKGEVDSAIADAEYNDTQVKADIVANKASIDAINNADTGILAQAKAYADGKDTAISAAQDAADAAQDDVDALEAKIGTVEDGKTVMGIIADIQANAYDDTAIKADIKANTDAIAKLNGDASTEGSVAKAVADAKALVDADVDAVEGRLDAIENVDTGILAQSKEYTNTTVANAVADVKAGLASALTYKGQKATEDELPTEGNVCGDVWNVATTDKGTSGEFVWVVDDAEAGTGHWEELGTALDLSAYAEKGQVATDIATAKGEAIAAAATDATTKANQALADAKTYADGLAGNYDEAGAADDALTEAKAYTDTEVGKANAAVTALTNGQVKTNTEAIAKNAEDIVALQQTLGEGVEPISSDAINALFA